MTSKSSNLKRLYVILPFALCASLLTAYGMFPRSKAQTVRISKAADHLTGRIFFSVQTKIGRASSANHVVPSQGYADILNVETGQLETMHDQFCVQARFSPDSRRVAVRAEDNKLSVLNVADRSLLPLGAIAEIVTWSPDSSRVVVRVPAGNGIETVALGIDDQSRTVLNVKPTELLHDWSPDGNWLLATSKNELKLLSLDGTTSRVLLRGAQCDQPRFSPDGRLIAYVGYGARIDLWYLTLDADAKPRLIKARVEPGVSVGWSPSGKQVFLKGQNAIRVVDLDGGNEQELIATNGQGFLGGADWSGLPKP